MPDVWTPAHMVIFWAVVTIIIAVALGVACWIRGEL